eukprot:1690518-Amphidinium_carterae.1
MELIWAMEDRYEPSTRSAAPTEVGRPKGPLAKEPERTVLEDDEHSENEDKDSLASQVGSNIQRTWMIMDPGASGKGWPGKRKTFLTAGDLWRHFFDRHMDKLLVETLVREWTNLATGERVEAFSWARLA